MAIKYSKEEINALERKAMDPQRDVFCPRCGKPLSYKSVGNSYEVKCPTKDCIKETVRGL